MIFQVKFTIVTFIHYLGAKRLDRQKCYPTFQKFFTYCELTNCRLNIKYTLFMDMFHAVGNYSLSVSYHSFFVSELVSSIGVSFKVPPSPLFSTLPLMQGRGDYFNEFWYRACQIFRVIKIFAVIEMKFQGFCLGMHYC